MTVDADQPGVEVELLADRAGAFALSQAGSRSQEDKSAAALGDRAGQGRDGLGRERHDLGRQPLGQAGAGAG